MCTEYMCRKCCGCCCAFLFAIIISVALLGLGVSVIVLNAYILIKDSLTDVPQQIQYLFHFLTTFFICLITYKVLKKPPGAPQEVQAVDSVNFPMTGYQQN